MESTSTHANGIRGSSSCNEKLSLLLAGYGGVGASVVNCKGKNNLFSNFEVQAELQSPAYHVVHNNQHFIIQPPQGISRKSSPQSSFIIKQNNQCFIIQPPQPKGLCASGYTLSQRRKHSKRFSSDYLRKMHLNDINQEVNLNSDFADAFSQDVSLPLDINVHKKSNCNLNAEGTTEVNRSCKSGTVESLTPRHNHVKTQPDFISSSKPSQTYLKAPAIEEQVLLIHDSNSAKQKSQYISANSTTVDFELNGTVKEHLKKGSFAWHSSQKRKTYLKVETSQDASVKTATFLKQKYASYLSIAKPSCIQSAVQKNTHNRDLHSDSRRRQCFQLFNEKREVQSRLGKFLHQLEEKQLIQDRSNHPASSTGYQHCQEEASHLESSSSMSQSVPKQTKKVANNMKKINLEQYRARKTNSEHGRSSRETDESAADSAFKLSPSSTEVEGISKAAEQGIETGVCPSSTLDSLENSFDSYSNLYAKRVSLSVSRSPPTSRLSEDREEKKGKMSCKYCEATNSACTSSCCQTCSISLQVNQKSHNSMPFAELTSDAIMKEIESKLAEMDNEFMQCSTLEAQRKADDSLPIKDAFSAQQFYCDLKETIEGGNIKGEKPVGEPDDEGEENLNDASCPSPIAGESGQASGKDPILLGGGSRRKRTSSDVEAEIKENVALLKAHTVWVGNYRVVPKEKVKLKRGCITLVLPTLVEDDSPVTIILKSHGIVYILAHLREELPVFFLYLKPSTATYVRRLLKMTNEQGIYFNPASENETLKRITILTEPIRMEFLLSIDDFFTNLIDSKGKPFHQIGYISLELANEIIYKAAPRAENGVALQKLYLKQEAETLLIYPPPPATGGITITTDDYCCLEEEQFLNDVILDFYLGWLMLSKVTPSDCERTHVFSTFFYKRLTSKSKKGYRPHSTEDDSALTPAQKRHARVRSWTKGVDIFAKDFIFIPINEHKHWLLAVICFPGLDGPIRMSDGKPASLFEKARATITKPKTRIEYPTMDDSECSDRDEAEGDDEELEDNDEDDPPSKKPRSDHNHKDQPQQPDGATMKNLNLSAERKEDFYGPIKQPCILIFDSLPGRSRLRIVATLRDYLSAEHLERKGVAKVFSKDNMKGACPKVPRQMNFSDCGLFTLQFAQSFFEHPLKDFRFPLPNMTNWFSQDVVACKREAIAKLIQSLMDRSKPKRGVVLPLIHFNSLREKSPPQTSPKGISTEKFGSLPDLLEENHLFLTPPDMPLSSHLKSPSGFLDDELLPHSSDIPKEPKRIKVTTFPVPIPRPKTPTPLSATTSSPSSFASDSDSGNHSDVEEKQSQLLKSTSGDVECCREGKFGLFLSTNSAFRPPGSRAANYRSTVSLKKLKAAEGAKKVDKRSSNSTKSHNSLISGVGSGSTDNSLSYTTMTSKTVKKGSFKIGR